MKTLKINNSNYSIASKSYNQHSKLIEKISQQALNIEDKISIGQKENIKYNQVNTDLSQPKVNRLLIGDQLNIDRPSNFWAILQEKFKKIVNTETISSNDIESETNLVELAATVNEAEIQLKQIVNMRDKFVAAFKEILNSTF